VADARFASARVDAAVALWPRVVDPAALTAVERRLGAGAARAVRGRLGASAVLRLVVPGGYCPPRLSTRLNPSSVELSATL